ncbi:MAG TPA: hypothetical protein VFZ61_03815 [Polyangiales bacterium]
MSGEQLTPFGEWVAGQPRGTMRKIELATGIAYSTIHAAKKRRVSRDVAEALAKQTGGALKWPQIGGARIGRLGASRAA